MFYKNTNFWKRSIKIIFFLLNFSQLEVISNAPGPSTITFSTHGLFVSRHRELLWRDAIADPQVSKTTSETLFYCMILCNPYRFKRYLLSYVMSKRFIDWPSQGPWVLSFVVWKMRLFTIFLCQPKVKPQGLYINILIDFSSLHRNYNKLGWRLTQTVYLRG